MLYSSQGRFISLSSGRRKGTSLLAGPVTLGSFLFVTANFPGRIGRPRLRLHQAVKRGHARLGYSAVERLYLPTEVAQLSDPLLPVVLIGDEFEQRRWYRLALKGLKRLTKPEVNASNSPRPA